MIFFYILVLLYVSNRTYGQTCANYLVKSGDTYSKLATQFKTTVQSISASNPLVNPSLLMIGK